MKHYRYILLLLTISLGLISCEREATIDPPKANPKLVIGAFISPQDSIIRVDVKTSTPIFGTRSTSGQNQDGLTDASVVLSDGTSSVTLSFNAKERKYTTDTTLFKIRPGKTYYLNVTTSIGLSANAQCTVPDADANIGLNIDEIDTLFSNDSKIYKVTFKCEDNPLVKNNYRFFAEGRVKYSRSQGLSFASMEADEDDLFSDTDVSSGTIIRKGKFRMWNSNAYLKRINGYLLNIDNDYYKYYKSLQSYSGDNPFAEPTLLYTNINGGLGVFCSYNKYMVVKDL